MLFEERHIIGALPDFVVPAAVLPVPDATDASTKAAAHRLLLAEMVPSTLISGVLPPMGQS